MPELLTTAIIVTYGLVTAYVAYWVGVGNAERAARRDQARLLGELDTAIDALTETARKAAQDRHPAGRELRIVR